MEKEVTEEEEKQKYLKIIYDYLKNKDTLTEKEIHIFYVCDLQGPAPYGLVKDKDFVHLLFELDDLAEEFEVSIYREDYLKYDKKLISILKKYGYYKEPKKS